MSPMPNETVILLAEDEEGHARLIEKNLRRAGLENRIERFGDGQELLDYLWPSNSSRRPTLEMPFLLLLDIRMPKVDGIEVLRQVKDHREYRKIPVIMLTTTDDPREVERAHELGCSNYIVKPVSYEKFAEAVKRLGGFIPLLQIPEVHERE